MRTRCERSRVRAVDAPAEDERRRDARRAAFLRVGFSEADAEQLARAGVPYLDALTLIRQGFPPAVCASMLRQGRRSVF